MRRFLAIFVSVFLIAGAETVAAASKYAAEISVNDRIITQYDIDQREALLGALGASGDLREQAVEQLIEDRLRLYAGEQMDIEISEEAIAAGLEEFAESRGLSLEDVRRVLEARGIDGQTMDDFVEAGLVWRRVVSTRFRARALPSDVDLDRALALAARTPREMLQIAEIALPFEERGVEETTALADRLYRSLSQGASFEAAVREYSRSGSAERGGLLPPVAASDLPPNMRSQILLLSPGQVARPIEIAGGLALLKLVSIRREAPGADPELDEDARRSALRQKLFAERIASFGDGYLQELRGDALIMEK